MTGQSSGGVQLIIPKNDVKIILNPVRGPSMDCFVRIKQTPQPGDTGVYRGRILDGNDLIAEIYVYAYRAS